MSTEIKNRWTGKTLMIINGADLRYADLRDVDLYGVDLRSKSSMH